jgi:hypothetical protein
MNMSNVLQENIPIEFAGDGMTIKSTHSGDKTYYAVDVNVTIRPITTKVFHVPDLQEDLLAGMALLE